LVRVPAFIGLGANVGDARRTLTHAVAALAKIPGARLREVSPLYRTTPVGVTDQPDFLNAVVALDVPIGADAAASAIDLLVALKNLERAFGRQRRGRWEARELDLDLLLFGGHRLAVERPPEAAPASAAIDPGAAARLLEVPHPAMRDRLFVLAPLADLAPTLVPPGWTETVAEAAERRRAAEGPDAARAIAGWSDADAAWIGPSGGPIVIEPPTEDDIEEAARVHTAAADAAYRGIAPPDRNGLERRTRVWREILENAGPSSRSFVARDAGRIVGVLNIGSFRGDDSAAAVRVLYVLPGWWGSGAGQQLLDRAHEELARDHDEAVLTVLAKNGRARRFYERNGWQLVETIVEPHFGDRPTEVTRYRRVLRTPRGST
jgi:2-amino-4-hydroxy-6-hydroxymethyldihydropteridine diphosphokinase